MSASLQTADGAEEGAICTALLNRWGGGAVFKAAPEAVMMAVPYTEHQALAARRKTPSPHPRRLLRHPKGDDVDYWSCENLGPHPPRLSDAPRGSGGARRWGHWWRR